MNIYLIPYTAIRHWVLGLILGATGLLAWWCALWLQMIALPALQDSIHLVWARGMDGALYLGLLTASVSSGTLLAEGALRRRALGWRFFYAALAGALALLLLSIAWGILNGILALLAAQETESLLTDPSLLTLRWRVWLWLAAGTSSGLAPFLVRRLHASITRTWRWGGRDSSGPPPALTWLQWALDLFAHVGGSTVAGAFAAIAWHVPSYSFVDGDLYEAAALAAFVFGAVHGWLVWPIPDDMYAGWIRVLSYERYGLRIPVPHTDGSGAERFVGHFPRGLDLYLPAESAVAELHASFVKTSDGRYTVRGLSIQPTVVRRFLERVDLRYDPRRPAPLETALSMEDRVALGPDGETVIEFLMLPREER